MVRLNRIYTRTGDDGTTGLVGGGRVRKDHARIEAYGTIDELNAHLGVLHAQLPALAGGAALLGKIAAIQQTLFDLGASLATLPTDRWAGMPQLQAGQIRWLENDIDAMNAELPALQSFVLPGGIAAVAQLHVARTVCRRAERAMVTLAAGDALDPAEIRFVNRLSDWLFVAGRWIGAKNGAAETLWIAGGGVPAGRAELAT